MSSRTVGKFRSIFSADLNLREAAATIFALSAILPLLVFLWLAWRFELIKQTEVQVALFLALVVAFLGFLVLGRLVDRVGKLIPFAESQKSADRAVLPDPALMSVVPGLGQVSEIGQIAATFSRLLEDLRVSAERLEDLVFKLGTLNELVELIARLPKVQDLLGLVLDRTMQTVRATIGSIMLLDRERQTLRIAAARGLSDEVIANVEVSLGEGIAGKVAQLREPVLVEDVETDPRFAKVNDPKYGGGSFICMPVRVGDRVIGVINLAKKEYGAVRSPNSPTFTLTDLQFLNTLMTHIAYALDNRLLEEARESAKRLQEVVADQQVRLSLAQQQKLQAEKVSALGQLLAGVAHELNNPLSVIAGQAALLRREAGTEPVAVRAEKIANAADRCARIVRNFLSLVRQQAPERRRVLLNDVVREGVELFAYQFRVDNVEVSFDLAADLPLLWADPHQLHQVVVNLVSNAHQAVRETPPPRRVSLATWHDPHQARVFLEVADTGLGILAEIQAQIFEPFFTTKPLGQGTGLGLSLCRGIIEAHGGVIRVESQPGQRTVFVVELPVPGLPGVQQKAEVPEPGLPSHGKRILVVDDEPGVAEVLAELLTADGHQVDTATNGRVALGKLQERVYDLVLSDIRMPELDGPGLYREIEQRYPGLVGRVIFLTGDTLSTNIREYLEKIGLPSLSKPFSVEEVRRIVQSALEGK